MHSGLVFLSLVLGASAYPIVPVVVPVGGSVPVGGGVSGGGRGYCEFAGAGNWEGHHFGAGKERGPGGLAPGGGPAPPAEPGSPAPRPDCSNMERLAAGIDRNIAVQHQELESLARVQVALRGGGGHDFEPARAELLAGVEEGRRIREANQQIPGAPEEVVKGLDAVAAAQAAEARLAEGLRGNAGDVAAIETLEINFNRGIEQNRKNMDAALQGCQGK